MNWSGDFVREQDDVAAGEIVAIAVLGGLRSSGVFGPCDLAPLVLDASVCLSVRMSYAGSRLPRVLSDDSRKFLYLQQTRL